MNERFEATTTYMANYASIKDNCINSPIVDVPFKTLRQAKDVAKWLNHNMKPYQRFEVRKHPNCKHPTYSLWDNETDCPVPFVPKILSTSIEEELEHIANWLNELVEGKNDSKR